MLVTLILDVDIFMLSLRENYIVVNKVYIFTNIQKKKKKKQLVCYSLLTESGLELKTFNIKLYYFPLTQEELLHFE